MSAKDNRDEKGKKKEATTGIHDGGVGGMVTRGTQNCLI
jgi:hypothetical protein